MEKEIHVKVKHLDSSIKRVQSVADRRAALRFYGSGSILSLGYVRGYEDETGCYYVFKYRG
jgi:hypothetical protein